MEHQHLLEVAALCYIFNPKVKIERTSLFSAGVLELPLGRLAAFTLITIALFT